MDNTPQNNTTLLINPTNTKTEKTRIIANKAVVIVGTPSYTSGQVGNYGVISSPQFLLSKRYSRLKLPFFTIDFLRACGYSWVFSIGNLL